MAIARINAYLQEHVTGMTVVQLFNRERRAYERVREDQRRTWTPSRTRSWRTRCITRWWKCFVHRHRLRDLVGGNDVLRGATTLGVLVAFMQYAQRFFRPIQDLSEKYNILQAAMASSERVFKLLDTPPDIVSPAARDRRTRPHRVRHVWFAYRKFQRDVRERRHTRSERLGAARRQLHHRAGRDGGHRRPHRRRQDHADQAADALLRRAARRDAH